MTTKITQPTAARPTPRQTDGLIAWMRTNIFGDATTALMAVLIGGALGYLLFQFLN